MVLGPPELAWKVPILRSFFPPVFVEKTFLKGDVHISGEDNPPDDGARKVLSMGALGVGLPQIAKSKPEVATYYEIKGSEAEEEEEEEEGRHFLEGHSALKFLLAGGVAGAGAFLCMAHG